MLDVDDCVLAIVKSEGNSWRSCSAMFLSCSDVDREDVLVVPAVAVVIEVAGCVFVFDQ